MRRRAEAHIYYDRDIFDTLELGQLKAPPGQYRLVLASSACALVEEQDVTYLNYGDYLSLDEATLECRAQQPAYGSSFIVYDDRGRERHVNA